MRISYRTHPILEKIAHRALLEYRVVQDDNLDFLRFKSEVEEDFTAMFGRYEIHTFFVSEEFFSASKIARGKLLRAGLSNEIEPGAYCFLREGGSGSFVLVDSNVDGRLKCEVVYFKENSLLASCTIYLRFHLGDEEQIESELTEWISKTLIKEGTRDSFLQDVVSILMVTVFMRYADVETQFLPANKKVKTPSGKHLNDTNLNVTYLNSTWFTNLVKSDSFKVRGHFRLQPKKKDGEWTKELIWINEFTKDGYTAPARMLKKE